MKENNNLLRMLKNVNESTKKKAGVIAILATLSITVVGFLVLFKILPYKLIGGGRLESYENAAMLAGFSIFIQVCLMYCTAVASNILAHKKIKKIAEVVLKIFIIYFVINIFMNLMGKTWFERIYCNIVCLIQIVCFIIITRKEKTDKSH